MQAHQLSRRWRAGVLLALGMLALFALAACGGGDKEDAPAGASQQAQPTVTKAVPPTPRAEPTATLAAPTAVAVIPATEPAPGSDHEALLLLMERSVDAERAGDWQAIHDMCIPELREKITADQIRAVAQPRFRYALDYDPENTSFRNVEVKLYGENTAILTFDVWQHDAEVGKALAKQYAKTDGKWYIDGVPCRRHN